jgi:hypothetical protein
MDWATFCNAIQAWLSAELGTLVTVRWADQNAARPAYPYALLNIIAESMSGVDGQRYTTNDTTGMLDVNIAGNRSVTVSIRIFTLGPPATGHANSARALAAQARSSLGKDSVTEALATAGIAVTDMVQIHNLDEFIEGRWVLGTALDVIFATASNVADTSIPYIETVDGTASFPPSSVTVNGPWGLGA